ncbi:hypothetical protein L6452_34099 [Arctium lappa]|uniref:Uncharacterized protein n=1 Tax=Arctium lappa TaxID=4217 RepID=A0ACB8YH91_ARCLA|nr:hypothetical protein L6452_34099 [Arctium lappa]
MADPRSTFRFRMPRLRPSVPPTRSTTRRPSLQQSSPPIPPQGGPPPSSTAPAQPPLPTSTAPTPTPTPPLSTAPAPTPPLSTAGAARAPAQPVLPPPPTSTASAPTPPIIPPPPVSTATTPTPPPLPVSTTTALALYIPPPSPSTATAPAPPVLPHASANPPSPSSTQLTSQPSSPAGVRPSPPPSPLASENNIPSSPPSPIVTTPKQASSPSSTPLPYTPSHNNQKDVHLTLNPTLHAINEVEEPETKTTTETNEETFTKQPRIEAPKVEAKQQDAINKTSNIPKSMISQPTDTESPQNPKPINRSEASADVTKSDTNPRKQFPNENPLNVITLAGDNRGTSMRINEATKRETAIRIHRRYKIDPDEIADTTTDEEESSNGKKSDKDSDSIDDLEKNAYINCNIQGINNSMVFNSSFLERNPGVHVGRNRENVNKLKRKKSKPKTDTNASRSSTTIRRRCLRGFFMESSDSDPHKPRRHGCRYTGGEKMEVV